MDVTLERVQFKFASIIGELCSKPLILSQFAIWVDLRLSEYKLKGAISLDCSGDKPNPDWLKGMRDSDEFSQSYPGSEHHRSASHGRQINHNRSVGETSDISPVKHVDIPSSRLSADAEFKDSNEILIKDDSDDDRHDVFPTGFHVHGTSYNNKRQGPQDTGGGELYTVTPHKMFKSLEQSEISHTANQSLMSIIGGKDSIIEASPVSLEDSQIDTDLGMAIQLQETPHMGDNSSFIPGRSSSHASSTLTYSTQETTASFDSPSKSSNFNSEPAAESNRCGNAVKSEHPDEDQQRFYMPTIKQEPEDHGEYEACWNASSGGQAFYCKSEPQTEVSNEDYGGTNHRIATNSPATCWLQSMVNRDSIPNVAASEGKRSLGSASQTLLSLLEKGRESVTKPGCESIATNNNLAWSLPSPSSTPTGVTLAALLTRTEKFTAPVPTPSACFMSRKVNHASFKGSPSSSVESDNISNETRGLTRLRRLLQGEDVPPLAPFKKRCDDIDSARAALKYYIARHKISTNPNSGEVDSSSDYVRGDLDVDLQLHCIFCDYTRIIEEESNFIMHVFSHANNGELERYHSVCPQCSISDLPMTEFVCHILSHCVVGVQKQSS